jgi:hypothetical protein
LARLNHNKIQSLIRLDKAPLKAILSSLRSDAQFLSKYNLMDYSMLLGVETLYLSGKIGTIPLEAEYQMDQVQADRNICLSKIISKQEELYINASIQ